ncbi:Peroxidase 17 [Bienertia sinuspersici]
MEDESGGPYWEVNLGRKDSLYASQEDSNDIMPSPRANASSLIDLFTKFNLSVEDLVALSSSHSIGKARCFSIVFRLYNQSGSGKPDPAIDPHYRMELDKLCPLGGDENVTDDLDATPTISDNQYIKDLVAGRGLINSDETYIHTRKQGNGHRVYPARSGKTVEWSISQEY